VYKLARTAVAVGTTIAGRPPHRSVRAALPHTAPTLDTGVKAHVRIWMQGAGHGYPPVKEFVEPLPREPRLLFLGVLRAYDYGGFSSPSRFRSIRCGLPFGRTRSASPLGSRSSISWPTDASVYASAPTSRWTRQDSRSGWFAIPFLRGSLIPCNMPVYPGARVRPTFWFREMALSAGALDGGLQVHGAD
jgi:hypothetical protein